MAKIKIILDGKEVEVKEGMNLVDAAEACGVDIPHYCYHPGLSVAGQCRMCVVEVEGNPKLQIACDMTCKEGLKIITRSEKVKSAVQANLEFHLINHPIDCPTCDQAGECGLQEYYMKHGKYQSAMHEEKVLKLKVVDLGEHVVLDKERCILCSRCVRFTQEISKTNDLAIFQRGDRSEIGTYEDQPLQGNYQLNTVDICPVGALTSKDFRFEQRVWYLEETKSVCHGCSQGCNVFVHHKKGRHIYRLKPRYNEFVNQHWMCDKGRTTYKTANFDQRLTHPKFSSIDLPYQEALQMWSSELKVIIATEQTEQIGVWLTPHHTNEELYAITETFSQLEVNKFYSENVRKLIEEDKSVDGFLLKSDPYPNSRGFMKTFETKKIKLQPQEELIQSLKKGALSHLVLFVPEIDRSFSFLKQMGVALQNNIFMALITPQKMVMDLFPTALILPSLSHYEKTGTIINHQGRAQEIHGNFKMFKNTYAIQDILYDLEMNQKQTNAQRKMKVL